MLETLHFTGKDWLPLAGGALTAAAVLLYYGYRRAPLSPPVLWTCVGLKLFGFALLLFCLLDPMVTEERAESGANLFAVVADVSEGMKLVDAGETSPRSAGVQAALATVSENWQTRLAEDFRLKRYCFDSHLANLETFDDLVFTGKASRLGDALRTLERRFRGQPLAGIAVFTDGVATDLEDGLPDLAGLPPVYPVVVGKGRPARDVALGKIVTSQTSFEDAPVTLTAWVRATGCAGEKVTVRLWLPGDEGKPVGKVEEKTLLVGGQESRLNFRFELRPAVSDVLFYKLAVSASGDEPEATQANNERRVTVDRGSGPYRILYVSGRANWEYKFLRRALEEDEQVSLVGLVRIAKKEPKFAFKGRGGEDANPLFRGFKGEEGDLEDYDKPVLIRLNTRDADELKTGFPATEEELFGYSAVILDDLEAAFFTPSQHALLQEFVSRRGGGLLMLGGQESFRQGEYARTPIGSLLPAYLDSPSQARAMSGLRLNLTREGWLQPWTRLRDNEMAEKKRLGEMPSFVSLNQVRGVKPGAAVFATASADGEKESHPALLGHKFGRGRVLACLLGDVWRWGMKDAESRADMDKAWRQLVRRLVADVPVPIELDVGRTEGAAGRSLVLNVRDEEFHPLDNAEVVLKVRPLDSNETFALVAEPAPERAGSYAASFVPRTSGGYLAEAEVREPEGKILGSARAGWVTDFAAAEYASLSPNRVLLEDLAARTGGRLLTLADLDAFAAELPSLRAPVTETLRLPLWHRTPFFLLALACFVAEWFLRRRKGMP